VTDTGLLGLSISSGAMTLSINTNLSSMTAQRNMGTAQAGLSISLQRLSSGLRINSAKDDAAGLAISERFTAQIRGLNQAARNANDAISLLQVAEGGMSTVASTLQRIRELAVQAANGTNSASDRQALQVEVSQLAQELDRIGRNTQFNGQAVFDQSQSSRVGDETKLAVFDGLTSVGSWLENSETRIREFFGLEASGATLDIRYTGPGSSDGVGGFLAFVQPQDSADAAGRFSDLKLQVDLADFAPPNLPDGGNAPVYNDRIIAHEMAHAVMAATTNWADLTSNHLWFVEGTAEFIQGADERLSGDKAAVLAAADAFGFGSSSSEFYSAGYAAVRYMHDEIKAAGGTGIKDVLMYMNENAGSTLNDALANASSGRFASVAAFKTDFNTNKNAYISALNLNNADTGAIGGLDADGGPELTQTSIVPNAGTRSGPDATDGFKEVYETIAKGGGVAGPLVFQVGANVNQTLETRIGAMNVGAMGLRNTLDVADLPAQAIVAVDRALEYVNEQRAVIGAQISRFSYAIENLTNTSDNLSASRSRVLDADFAVETAALLRQQILTQSSTAIVAQANQLPSLVLSLLR